jgi:carotenoid cleavage dioxygenase-like enzyme
VGHWFDGDGAVLAVHFGEGKAEGVYRYVQTAAYQAEEQADQFRYSNYGMYPPGPFWQRFRGLKNAANTSVLALSDRLLALWEGGWPHALDRQTLATLGADDLGGLAANATYSAHPKRDGQTGEIFNVGARIGPQARINLYRSDAKGRLQQQGSFEQPGVAMLHDFVLAGRYLILCLPPLRLHLWLVLLGLKPYSQALQWQPQHGTEIVVCDRETLSVVSRIQTEPWFQWHFGNGAELADGSVVFDVVRYADFATNQFLQEVVTGSTTTPAPAQLWRVRLEPRAGRVLQMVSWGDRHCEFPTVKPQVVGQPWRYTYLSLQRSSTYQTQELLSTIGRFDHETGDWSIATMPDSCYATEATYAPDAAQSDRGWLLAVVFDGQRNCSEVWAWDADRLEDGPILQLALPEIIPIGFHGTWQGSSGLYPT